MPGSCVDVELTNGEIQFPIAIEISYSDRPWRGIERNGIGGLKGPASFSEKHQDTARLIGHNKILMPVTIQVRYRQRPGSGTGGSVQRRLKRPVAVSNQDADAAAAGVGHGKIQPSVAVEITGYNSKGSVANGIAGSGTKGDRVGCRPTGLNDSEHCRGQSSCVCPHAVPLGNDCRSSPQAALCRFPEAVTLRLLRLRLTTCHFTASVFRGNSSSLHGDYNREYGSIGQRQGFLHHTNLFFIIIQHDTEHRSSNRLTAFREIHG